MALLIDETATTAALRAAGARVSRLLSGVRDPNQRAAIWSGRSPKRRRTSSGRGELCAGFITGEHDSNTYLRPAHNATTPGERNAVGNRLWLQEFAERDLSRLAPMVLDRSRR